ncbi:MAG: trypsin-like peptidase domain-containing protein [Solirubrobacteraceae bacterium]
MLLVTSALLGGGASTGLLAAAGVIGRAGSQTTVVRSSSSTSSGGLDAQALYASSSAGTVDITSKGISTGSDQPASPFGGSPQQSQATATGTGFVVDGKGHIVTASHVVDGASSVTVTLQDGTARKATVLGQDDATDVAVLKIDASGLTLHPLTLASSASLTVGDEVAAIGDPFGYQRSISTGIVSGVDRTVKAPNGFTVAHAVQTDAALNPGNSGGPLLNAAGQVIGVVDQIATNGSAEQSSGVGFAIPIDLVRSQLSTLEAGQKVSHAYLGIASSSASTDTAGAALASVTSGGPAAAAGLRAGDVVTNLAGTAIKNPNDLVAAVAARQPGDRVKLTVERGSRTLDTTVTLGTQPAQSASGG